MDQNIKSKILTINEFAALIEEDYITTSNFLKVLLKCGGVKEAGNKPNPEGVRGKPSKLFEIPHEIELVFFNDEENGLTGADSNATVNESNGLVETVE